MRYPDFPLKFRPWLLALVALTAVMWASNFTLFYYRDNFSTHLPLKSVSAEAYRSGAIPFWNFHSGGGQPLAGNPNLLTFYPDNWLYVVFAPRVAFNLHFWLHLFAAFGAMYLLLRTLSVTRSSALSAALLYTCSGAVISSTAFYNLVAVAALVPLIWALLHRFLQIPNTRRAFELGAAAGVLGLAAEPLVTVGTAIGCLVLLSRRAVVRAALVRFPLAIAVAIVVALPQLLATADVFETTERALHRYSAQTVLAASLPPWRLLEFLLGPFFGVITDYTASGFSANAPAGSLPTLFISLFVSAALIPALLHRTASPGLRYKAIAIAMLLLALGRFNPILVACVENAEWLRFMRFPEKLVIHFTAASVVLIAFWLDGGMRRSRLLVIGSTVGLAGVAIALSIARSGATTQLRLALGVAAAVAIALAAFSHRDRALRLAVVVPAVIAAVLTIPLARYTNFFLPDSALQLPPGERVWRDMTNDRVNATAAAEEYRRRSFTVDPVWGAQAGLHYALDRSPEGMGSYFTRIVTERATRATPVLRERYAQLLGCSVVITRDARGNGFPRSIRGTVPYVRAVRRVTPTRSIGEAVKRIESPDFDVRNEIVGPSEIVAPKEVGNIRDVRRTLDTIMFRVDSNGGAVAVVNETFFPAWRASANGRSLTTFPANLDRIGVVVPAGTHDVVVTFGRNRTAVYFAAAVSMLLVFATLVFALAAAWRSRNATASPARYNDPATTAQSDDDSIA